MPYKEEVIVCSEIHTKQHKYNVITMQNLLNVKPDDA